LIDLTDDIVTFPIDKIVVNKLKKEIVWSPFLVYV
jgi:hypothetical protein